MRHTVKGVDNSHAFTVISYASTYFITIHIFAYFFCNLKDVWRIHSQTKVWYYVTEL